MGYSTSHSLEMVKGDDNLIAEFINSNEDASYAMDENGETEESCKWYNHKTDMKNFSILHPNAIFKLSGEGEETGDIWQEYYKNGKMQRCNAIITFDEFNESQLQ